MPTKNVNGIDLYYETAGAGEPLVFVHGIGSSTLDWELQVPAFSAAYRVITFDLRGHGRSQKAPGPYTIALFAADLADLLEALDTGPVHLAGLSLGGIIAFQFAVDYPQMLKTLTIANSAPTFDEDPAQTDQAIAQRAAIVSERGMRGMGEVVSEVCFPYPHQADLRQMLVSRWAENDPRTYTAALRALSGWDVRDTLAAIACPALVISSDKDVWPLELKEAYTAQMRAARLAVIPDAHHFVTLEKPEAFNAVLRAFLAQHASRSG